MSPVNIVNLHQSYGTVEVLKDLNLEIREGEFLALVGPSGCGKSTLLRVLAGLEEITQGHIVIDGQTVNDLTPRERNIAMVFQSYALYPHMTVEENISFNLRISGLKKSEIKDRVIRTAEILNLQDLLKRKPSQLSGGQRQRVAMGRALVRNPTLFLFDEPLSNLDAKLRVQMREEIKRLHNAAGVTSIYVTHDQIEAMTLANRIVILNEGRIQQIGTPAELYQSPANHFVAGFIGSPAMNFLNADMVIQKEKKEVILTLSNGTQLNADPKKNHAEEGPVIVGIRPEHLTLSTRQKQKNTLSGYVELIEPTGAQNFIKVKTESGPMTVLDPDLKTLEIGKKIFITANLDKIHIFPQASIK